MSNLLTVKEVADTLRVSPGRVYQIVADNRLPIVRFGPRSIRIPADDFKTWLAGTLIPAREKRSN